MSRLTVCWSVAVLAFSACPSGEPPDTECPVGVDTGFGLRVDFTGRVDGEGGTATGGATLFSQPAATLVVPLSAREQFEVSPASLTFTPENWDVPQQVTVRAKPGVRTADITEGTVTSLIVGPTQSADASLRCQFGFTGFVPLPRCGDGVVDAHRNETCEPPQDRAVCPAGQASCQVCGAECRLVDGIPNLCGDGRVTADEACDGAPTLTCDRLGFDFGTARCSPSTCQHDTTDCVRLACDAGTAGCDPRFPAPSPDDGANCLHGGDLRARCWGISLAGHERPPAATFLQLADGVGHACGVTAGGTAQCWGENGAQQATPRGGPFSKVVVGHYHSCGLGVGGEVTCWGADDYRLSVVPAGGPFTDLASGDNHVCALTQAGEAKCWGRRSEAQTFPPDLRFTRLAAAANHACGLDALGAVTCWGNFGPGRQALTLPGPWAFVDLVVVAQDVCGLTTAGQLVCAGQNTGDLRPPPGFVPVSLGDASSGLCALDAQGRAHCWGQFDAREPLQGEFRRVDTGVRFCGIRTDGGGTCGGPGSVTSSQPLAQLIAVDAQTTCSVTTDGGATCTMRWQSNGQDRAAEAPPVTFSRLVVFDQVACGQRPSGVVACWGNVPNGGTGVPQEPFTDFAHNSQTGCGVLAATGALSCWGLDPFGLRTPPTGTFTQVRLNRLGACALRTDGSLACWGEAPPPPPAGNDFVALAMGENGGACALRAGGGLTCWGRENLTGVPHDVFASLQATPTSAAARAVDGGLRLVGPGRAAFEPGSAALVEAPLDALVVGARSVCARHGEGVLCVTPEDTVVRHLREVEGDGFATDTARRQCWLVDGGWPRCNAGTGVLQEPLSRLVLAGDRAFGLTRDGGALVSGTSLLSSGPFEDLEAAAGTSCVRRAGTRLWECTGLADGGVRGTWGSYDALALARTDDFACGLGDGGAATCWGNGTTRPLASVPAGAWRVLRLGRSHGCGLRPDASVQCWGASSTGALQAPAGAFDDVGVGDGFSCAVRAGSRQLVCWGEYGVNATQ